MSARSPPSRPAGRPLASPAHPLPAGRPLASPARPAGGEPHAPAAAPRCPRAAHLDQRLPRLLALPAGLHRLGRPAQLARRRPPLPAPPRLLPLRLHEAAARGRLVRGAAGRPEPPAPSARRPGSAADGAAPTRVPAAARWETRGKRGPPLAQRLPPPRIAPHAARTPRSPTRSPAESTARRRRRNLRGNRLPGADRKWGSRGFRWLGPWEKGLPGMATKRLARCVRGPGRGGEWGAPSLRLGLGREGGRLDRGSGSGATGGTGPPGGRCAPRRCLGARPIPGGSVVGPSRAPRSCPRFLAESRPRSRAGPRSADQARGFRGKAVALAAQIYRATASSALDPP